ncbi:MAG: tetratricopeptide repeat protein [Alphaproteobacteria bacterium]|nr:tetratricopeptide repeat protein [Alphaproteobacteria bacterium]
MLADPYAQGLKLSAKGQHAQAIEQFERALAADPDDPRTLFALGNTARALGMSRPAEEFYRRVLTLEPGRLEATVNLANLLRGQGQFEAAAALLRPALAGSPEAPELWLTLGSTYREMGDAAQAKEHYREAIARRPHYAAALGNLGDLLADDGEHDAAMALYDRALKAEPDNAQAKLNRAVLHLLKGDLKQGWRDYAARLKLAGKVPLADHGLARWSGGPLRRTRLLVTAEQGVGDQIMFASVIPELADRAAADGGTLILECEPRLAALFARSFPSIAVRAWDIEGREGVTRTRYGWLKAAGGANAFVEMGSLPRVLRNDIASFPSPHAFLRPDDAEAVRWRNAFAALPRPLVGVCWRSGSRGGHRAIQYAPLERWADFVRDLPGTVVCTQYDATAEEIAALSALSGRDVVVPRDIDQKNELDRTAALLSVLDAVVSAPTAVSWLAAATGVATYKILYDTSWTSFGQTYEPFAPSALCMMPRQRGEWTEVFAQTLAKLPPAPR